MKKPKKDPVREDRIHNEAIVDANGPEEQVMGWYYYLDDKIRFPFQAKCFAAKVVSPLRKGETVEVQRMAPEDACSADMLVLIRWHGRTLAVPLSQLVAIDPDQSAARPLATGITGWRRVTASEPCRPAGHYAALPKAHKASATRHGWRRWWTCCRDLQFEFGISPVRTFWLHFSQGGRTNDQSRPRLCPGTPLVLGLAQESQRTRSVLTIDGVQLIDYQLKNFWPSDTAIGIAVH